MKVLVVEDNISLAKNIVEYLKIKDIRSEHLYDGKKALESILSSHYDAVILDINLPSMD
jgi:DNA-binding response OmpR family regulator